MATDTQTVIQREAPEIEAYKIGLMEQAKDLAGKAPTAEQLELLKKKELGLSELQEAGVAELQSQIDAGEGIGGYKQYLEDAGTTLDDAITASDLSTKTYDTAMTQEYMNPYQQAVTQAAIDQMNKQYGVQKTGRDAKASDVSLPPFANSLKPSAMSPFLKKLFADTPSCLIFLSRSAMSLPPNSPEAIAALLI